MYKCGKIILHIKNVKMVRVTIKSMETRNFYYILCILDEFKYYGDLLYTPKSLPCCFSEELLVIAKHEAMIRSVE